MSPHMCVHVCFHYPHCLQCLCVSLYVYPCPSPSICFHVSVFFFRQLPPSSPTYPSSMLILRVLHLSRPLVVVKHVNDNICPYLRCLPCLVLICVHLHLQTIRTTCRPCVSPYISPCISTAPLPSSISISVSSRALVRMSPPSRPCCP